MNRSFLDDQFRQIKGEVLFVWTLPPRTEHQRCYEDIAKEYLVVKREKAIGGLVVYADWENGGFQVNPWNTRHLIGELLRQLGKAV